MDAKVKKLNSLGKKLVKVVSQYNEIHDLLEKEVIKKVESLDYIENFEFLREEVQENTTIKRITARIEFKEGTKNVIHLCSNDHRYLFELIGYNGENKSKFLKEIKEIFGSSVKLQKH